MVVATDSQRTSADGSTIESMMSFTVAVGRYSACGARHAPIRHRLPPRRTSHRTASKAESCLNRTDIGFKRCLENSLRNQQHLARGVPTFEPAVRLRGVAQRQLAIEAQADRAGRDRVEHL